MSVITTCLQKESAMSLEYIAGLVHQDRESRLLDEVAAERLARQAGGRRRRLRGWHRRAEPGASPASDPATASPVAVGPVDPHAPAAADRETAPRVHQPVG